MHVAVTLQLRVMLHHQPFQPSLTSQAQQQLLKPVLSSRRALAEQHPDPLVGGSRRRTGASEPSGRGPGRIRSQFTNQEALEALSRCTEPEGRRALRDQLVRNNLPLVYAISARMGRTQALPQDDLRQIGSLGLLRAIEAFEPSRGRTLSSFAVPYIRGAIQHELRDRASLMRIPRPLWELRRRASVLQDRRRRLGQPQLAPAELAEALNCSTCQVVEALQVSAVVEMRSLDAPSSPEAAGEPAGRTLLEQLPDPASLGEALLGVEEAAADAPLAALFAATPTRSEATQSATEHSPHERAAPGRSDLAELCSKPQLPSGWPRSPERSWLQQRLQELTEQERQLLEGHVCQGRSWAELGRDLDLHPRQAQRRTVALLSRLAEDAKRWRDGDATKGAPA